MPPRKDWGSVEHQREVARKVGVDPDKFNRDSDADWEDFKQKAFKAVTDMATEQDDRSLLATIFGWS